MNKYNRAALNAFCDMKNVRYVYNVIMKKSKYRGNPQVERFLKKNLATFQINYTQQLDHDFITKYLMNTEYPEPNVQDQVAKLNTLFVSYMLRFIERDLFASRIPFEKPPCGQTDGLKANAGSATFLNPRSILCDTDTTAVDDPNTYFGTPSPYRTKRTFQTTYGNHFRRDFSKPMCKGEVAKTIKDQADSALERMWYANRPHAIRDDPVGEIVRDAWQPCGQYCHKTKSCPGCKMFGNNSNAEGMSSNKMFGTNSNVEGMSSSNKNVNPSKCNVFGETEMSRPDQNNQQEFPYGNPSGNPAQPRILGPDVALANQNRYPRGRRTDLCSYKGASVNYSSAYSGAPDTTENGVFENRFTGASPEYADDHVNRLLGTPYIQTLNSPYGGDMKVPAILSTFNRGKFGRRDMMLEGMRAGNNGSANPQNNTKLWTDGAGFVDDTNPAAMKHLLEKRSFRGFNYVEGGPLPTDSAADQIPFFQKALHNRYYDKNADESVGGFETGALSRGYGKDMMSLYCRSQNRAPCGKTRKPMPQGYKNLTGLPDWQTYTPS